MRPARGRRLQPGPSPNGALCPGSRHSAHRRRGPGAAYDLSHLLLKIRRALQENRLRPTLRTLSQAIEISFHYTGDYRSALTLHRLAQGGELLGGGSASELIADIIAQEQRGNASAMKIDEALAVFDEPNRKTAAMSTALSTASDPVGGVQQPRESPGGPG